jgi:site-specific DNA recombinase
MKEVNDSKGKLIAIYARVSTATQEQQETVKTQLIALKDFAAAHSYQIVQQYVDDGWSGDILARPQLDKLRQDAARKLWQAVLIYDPDRLARRYSYQELVMDELRDRGVEVIFVTTPAPKTGEEKILHGVKGLFAEYERAKITERFRLGKIRKVREGNILLSEAPYGYRYIPKNSERQGYLEVDRREAQTLRLIFTWVAEEGMTIRGVVRKLSELGIQPRKSKRGVWSTSTIGHLLRNRTFVGEAHYGASYATVPEKPLKTEGYRKYRKTSRKQRPEPEWIKIAVPAILDRSLFERTQRQLKTNFELSRRNRKNEYLLSGKIWCGCSARRAGEGVQGKHLYYRCTSRIKSFPLPSSCREPGIDATATDALVWSKLQLLMSDPKLLRQQILRWVHNRRSGRDQNTDSLAATSESLAKLREQEQRYVRAYGAGLFSLEQLSAYASPIQERIRALEQEIAKRQADTHHSTEEQLPNRQGVALFARQSARMLKDLNFEARQAIVRNVITRVVVAGSQLDIVGIIPVHKSNESNVAFSPIHRHGWDTTRNGIPFELHINVLAPRKTMGIPGVREAFGGLD